MSLSFGLILLVYIGSIFFGYPWSIDEKATEIFFALYLAPIVLFSLITFVLGKIAVVNFGSSVIDRRASTIIYLGLVCFGLGMALANFGVTTFADLTPSDRPILGGAAVVFCLLAGWAGARCAQLYLSH